MFGWLTHALATMCPLSDAADRSLSRSALPISAGLLAECLPLLGSVLYLPARRCVTASVPQGWLVGRGELAPLLQTRALVASTVIGADGPREWIDCLDARGRFCARLHLLPDTDYLAWDALLSHGCPLPDAPLRASQLICPAAHAELLHFRVRRVGTLSLLESLPAERLSLLGCRVARDAARAAALELMPAWA